MNIILLALVSPQRTSFLHSAAAVPETRHYANVSKSEKINKWINKITPQQLQSSSKFTSQAKRGGSLQHCRKQQLQALRKTTEEDEEEEEEEEKLLRKPIAGTEFIGNKQLHKRKSLKKKSHHCEALPVGSWSDGCWGLAFKLLPGWLPQPIRIFEALPLPIFFLSRSLFLLVAPCESPHMLIPNS